MRGLFFSHLKQIPIFAAMSTPAITLVYGNINNNLVILPEADALLLARKWEAIHTANTWADFIRLTSQETFDDLVLEILETLGHEALFPQYLMGEDLSNYITDLHLPQPEDPFTTSILPGFDEGEYMPNPAQEIIAWLPEDLQEHLGEIVLDDESGFIYRIDPEQTPLVVASLQASAYLTRLDQNLVEQACGQA